MKNQLQEYDIKKLQEARLIISKVHDYNYVPCSPISNKLHTILDKLDKLIETEGNLNMNKKLN